MNLKITDRDRALQLLPSRETMEAISALLPSQEAMKELETILAQNQNSETGDGSFTDIQWRALRNSIAALNNLINRDMPPLLCPVIEIEFPNHTILVSAVSILKEHADRTDTPHSGVFNGVRLVAYPGDTAETIRASYEEWHLYKYGRPLSFENALRRRRECYCRNPPL
jgi:hypothetical protein